MFIGNVGPVAAANAIDLSGEPKSGTGEFYAGPFAVFIGFDAGVKFPACKDGGIGDADFLDFFEIKKPLAIPEGMESHHPDGRHMGIDGRERDHGDPSPG
jgi:hypothetical protein